MKLRIISIEDSSRTTHILGCIGYDDCECFDAKIKHCDLFKLQKLMAAAKDWRDAGDNCFLEERNLIKIIDEICLPNPERLPGGTNNSDINQQLPSAAPVDRVVGQSLNNEGKS